MPNDIVNFSGNGILLDSAGNTIGSTTTGNVISGNGGDGILIDGPNAALNVVVANFIGTNAAGSAALGNAGNGIEITNGANRNLIGGNTSMFSNVVFAATPTPTPTPPPVAPTPVGQLTPFGFGFGPGFQLELLDVDTQGQVFTQTLGANLFTGVPTFVNSDLIFSNVQLLNGLVFGFLQEQGHPQDLVEILNFANPFVFNAVLTAMMKPT